MSSCLTCVTGLDTRSTEGQGITADGVTNRTLYLLLSITEEGR